MILDKLGHEINAGDYIAYGSLVGNSGGLRIGKVLKTAEFTENRWGRDTEVQQVIVRGCDDHWTHNELSLCGKNGTLMYPATRVVRLDPDSIPSDYYALLDPIEVLE